MPRSGEVCGFMPLSAGALAGELWVARPVPRAGRLVAALAAVGLGLTVGLLPLEGAAWVVAGGIVVLLAFVEPLVALAALLVMLPVSTLVTLEAGDFSVTAIEPLMVLLVATWLARGIARRDVSLASSPILVALDLVLLAVLASSLAAERPGLAYKETIKWLELVMAFLFTVANLRGEGRQRAILAVLLLTGAAEALYGAFQYATGEGPAAFVVGEALRAYGHFEQPNPFAGYLGTILPLGLALAASRRPPGLAVMAGLATAATAAGILLSLSRGAWMGIIIGLAAMLAAWSPAVRRWLIPSVAGLALVVLLTAGNVLPGGWSDRLVAVVENFGIFDVRTVDVTSENFAVVERMAHWQAGWYMLLDHPLLGVGAGNYPAAYEMYSLPGWREPLGHAHNYYLNMAAETGLPGAAALLGLMGVIYRTILRGLKRRPPGSFARALLVGLLGSFVVLTVHNLFDNLLVHGMSVQVGLLLGLLNLAANPADGERLRSASPDAAPPA